MGLESVLKKHLHRALCPDPVELGEYQMGSLPASQAAVIRRHLEECPRCRTELTLMENYFGDLRPDIEYSLGERVKTWVARLLPQPGLSLAFGVRGEEQAGLLRYEFGGAEKSGELAIEIQEDAAHPGRKTILGMLTGVGGEGLQAVLSQTGQAQIQTTVDEVGNLAMDNLPPGEYDLWIRGVDFEIFVQNLKV